MFETVDEEDGLGPNKGTFLLGGGKWGGGRCEEAVSIESPFANETVAMTRLSPS